MGALRYIQMIEANGTVITYFSHKNNKDNETTTTPRLFLQGVVTDRGAQP